MKSMEEILAFLESGQPPPQEAGLFGATVPEEWANIHIIGVPWDVTTSYGKGTWRAPDGIRAASHQLDLVDHAFGATYRTGIALRPLEELEPLNHSTRPSSAAVIEALERGEQPDPAHLQRVNEATATMNAAVEQAVRESLAQGKQVGLLGGDHSTPLGALRAHALRHDAFGVLHIDAHHDLRCAYEGFVYSHASIFCNVLQELPQVTRLVSVGIRDYSEAERRMAEEQGQRVVTWYDEDLFAQRAEGTTLATIVDRILDALPPTVYVSLDIDGLCQAYSPHTGTPVPGGLGYHEVVYLLNRLGHSDRTVIGFDLVEVVPSDNEWDANVGARLLYKLCGLLSAPPA